MFVVDDATRGPDFRAAFFPPRDDERTDTDPDTTLADTIYEVIAALPDHTVPSQRALFAQVRLAGHQVRQGDIRNAVDDLVVAGRLVEVSGKRGATGYRVVATAAQTAAQENST